MRFAKRIKKEVGNVPRCGAHHKKEKLAGELGYYFIAELCDMLKRLDTCGIPRLHSLRPRGWLNQRGLHKELAALLADMEVKPGRLCLTIPPPCGSEDQDPAGESEGPFRSRLQRNVFRLCPGAISLEELKENGATMFRLGSESCQSLTIRRPRITYKLGRGG
jgi:hypothetical protein